MYICYQYWFSPRPKYGRDLKCQTIFSPDHPIIKGMSAHGLYEPVVVWKRKTPAKQMWHNIKKWFQ